MSKIKSLEGAEKEAPKAQEGGEIAELSHLHSNSSRWHGKLAKDWVIEKVVTPKPEPF